MSAVDEIPADLRPQGESLSLDSETSRAQNVYLRHHSQIGAMAGRERTWHKIKHIFSRICCVQAKQTEAIDTGHGDGDYDDDSLDLEEGVKQYRLEAARKNKKTCLQKILCCFYSSSAKAGVGITPNRALAQYLHWMFRINFFFLFALSCIVFFALTFVFAGFIVWAGRMDKTCVRIGAQEFDANGAAFADAFALSWTTFSTVGYGSTYPALGPDSNNPNNCMFITGICSLESFIGVLYSGFCGAILFGKVLRIQSHAQVIFSDPIVIRYGGGVEAPLELRDDGTEIEENVAAKKQIPCPVLEFRIVNRLFNDVGGEIMDATLNAVANVDASDSDPSGREASILVRDETGTISDTNSETGYSETGYSDNGSDSGSSRFRRVAGVAGHKFLDPMHNFFGGNSDRHTIEEDPSSRLVNKRIFSKMLIEASEHPFFKRVWLARHVLDDTSPLLSPKARRAIRKNGGFWPAHLNNYEGVRKSLDFNQILVSLSGVSNVSAADVYAQKIYDVVDVNIGYQFVNLLYRDGEDGALKVDTTLINDVKEQNGGGGEPLMLGE